MAYRGNKGLKNLYPNIINEFPPHIVFWELCAGSWQITKKKAPARFTAVVDKDNSLVQGVEKDYHGQIVGLCDCAISILKELKNAGPNHLVYIDPPYHPEAVKNIKYYYKHWMSAADHLELCLTASAANCNIAISHYDHPIYDELLKGWRKKTIRVNYHGVIRSEAVYFNYAVPEQLHETTFSGRNKTHRQQIKRKTQRLIKKLLELPAQERQVILTAIDRSFK